MIRPHRDVPFLSMIWIPVLFLTLVPGPSTAQTPFSQQDAINILMSDVINPSPDAATSVAFLHNYNTPDSLLLPGTMVSSWDDAFVHFVTSESYFFWVAKKNDHLMRHPTEFAFVDAFAGALTTFSTSEAWPVVNGIQATRFMEQGNASPGTRLWELSLRDNHFQFRARTPAAKIRTGLQHIGFQSPSQ